MAPRTTCECGQCAKCKRRVYMREYYAKNAERVKETARASRRRRIDSVREYDRERYHNNPERRTYTHDRAHQWRRDNPDKAKAHAAVSRALRSGALERQNCELCGREDSHGHHDDYGKPLEVRWLCPVHHAEAHA